MLQPPVVGTFTDGVGEFFGKDLYADEEIYARLHLVGHHRELRPLGAGLLQDGGQTWVTNWTMDFTRR